MESVVSLIPSRHPPCELGLDMLRALLLVSCSVLSTASAVPVVTIDSFTVTPAVIEAGGTATLAWQTSNASSVTLNGSDVTGRSSMAVSPETTAGYTLVASSGGTTVTQERQLIVRPPHVRINEIMADNSGGVQDEDGEWSDWIELHNPSNSPVNLGGMFLTGDRAWKSQWAFPAGTMIAAKGYLLVFASGKNRATAGSELHANFKLGDEGEYLALIAADGVTVISALSPGYPRLSEGVSYGYGLGPGRVFVPLVPPQARYLVATSPVAGSWRGGSTFDDAAWAEGAFDFGYAGSAAHTAYQVPFGTAGTQNYGGSLGMDFVVESAVEVTELGVFDASSNGIAGGSTQLRAQLYRRDDGGTPEDPEDDFAIEALLGQALSFTAAAPGALEGGHRFQALGSPLVLEPGAYTIVSWGYNDQNRIANQNLGVGSTDDGGGLLRFNGRSRYGSAGAFPEVVDTHPHKFGAGTFRYRPLESPFATDVEAEMKGASASLLTRQRFVAAQDFHALRLQVDSDDGFVAWLNGSEVARLRAPAAPDHTSTATAAGDSRQSFTIPGSALHQGENVLAIQGLNLSAGDADFHLDAELSAETAASGWVHFFTPTPGAANGPGLLSDRVVINELHCDSPDSKSRHVEYIELFNPLPVAVDLSGWAFTKGVDFTFPAVSIPAGGFLVIAEDPAHLLQFAGVSGALGPWTGRLSNDGENLELSDALGRVVDQVNFEIGFPWPTVGGDPGNSMQRLNEGLDPDLGGSWRSALPTPGAANLIATATVPPAVRQVVHTPAAPLPGQAVTVTATVSDPDGIDGVLLEYQVVSPGNYIRLADPEWSSGWTALPMRDDGSGGDALAGDDRFTAVVPAAVQIHRQLVRYRIVARDHGLAEARVPYADDPCPNFAWFCYGGVPNWTAAVKPGETAPQTFGGTALSKVAPWHLLSRAADVTECQYGGVDDGLYKFEGALVIDGRVYDHVRYRVKGQNSTFVVGKNKWKFRFNRGHELDLAGDYGAPPATLRTLNLSSLAEPWAKWNRGLAGLDEAAGFKLYNLAGATAPRTRYVHFRVLDAATEQVAGNQYEGDFWGLYLAFENQDNRYKEAHGLPDGNIFRLRSGSNSLLGQGRDQPSDLSDLDAFISGYSSAGQSEAWFRANVNLPQYYSWRSITEAINQTDRREQENVVYFRNPDDGRWEIHPWDIDLLYEQLDRWGPQGTQSQSSYERIQNCLNHPAIRIEWQNRARELQDLLLNSDQAWKVMDETVSLLGDGPPRLIPNNPADPGYLVTSSIVEADRRLWDRHPRSSSKGIFYQTPFAIPDMNLGPPQPYFRSLATGDFPGMLKWAKDFVTGDAHGGGRLAAMAQGTVHPLTLAVGGTPVALPATPTITYTGVAGFPANNLKFRSSTYAASGGTAFKALQWRIGEVHDPSVAGFQAERPWQYEIEPVWTSAVLTAFAANVTAPATGIVPGRSYRARVRHQNQAGHWSHWSAPLQFSASGAQPGNLATDLVISEIMYNPPEGTDYEYIELQNISTDGTLDLTGVGFTEGIVWNFPDDTLLAPGERIIVAKRTTSFRAKHGSGPRVAGQYFSSSSASLDNAGETLTLGLGPSAELRRVPYLDEAPWPVEADGAGFSLTLVRPASNPDHEDPFNWRAGSATPGGTDVLSYASWKSTNGVAGDNDDPDGDGIPNLAEYALGGDPHVPDTSVLPQIAVETGGSITVTFTRWLRAEGATWAIEHAGDLADWQPAPGAVLIERTVSGDRETFSFRLPSALPAWHARFVRMNFTATP